MLARMQKAIAILQFKLEGQTSRRHPEWEMGDRDLLHRIDRAAGTVEIDGKQYPLLDRNLPTRRPRRPVQALAGRAACMDRLRDVVRDERPAVAAHVVRRAARGDVDAPRRRADLPRVRAGRRAGPARCRWSSKASRGPGGRCTTRSTRSSAGRSARAPTDLDGDADWLWYLWAGPKSPLFGKDKMATFEGHFVADKDARHEHKNPYFEFIHDAEFVKRIGRDFGMGDDVLIVNGHVPVKVEKGEQPVKRGGNAVTIDGAFSEAYGDRGYTLILAPDGIKLAEHYHFESVEQVIETGADIIPKMTTIQSYAPPAHRRRHRGRRRRPPADRGARAADLRVPRRRDPGAHAVAVVSAMPRDALDAMRPPDRNEHAPAGTRADRTSPPPRSCTSRPIGEFIHSADAKAGTILAVLGHHVHAARPVRRVARRDDPRRAAAC